VVRQPEHSPDSGVRSWRVACLCLEETEIVIRVDGRAPDQMREVRITPNFLDYAEGSCLIEIGKTRVACSATVDNRVPPHVHGSGRGWITAEYAMLPRSSQQRIVRDGVRGKIGGRSHEIQRLIGRSLRAIFDLKRFGERTVILDCDVIQADGGTRCASITGAYVALALALAALRRDRKLSCNPLRQYLAAVSVGIVESVPVLDLCYLEDAQAHVDMNMVMTGDGRYVEIQGTAEAEPFSAQTLERMQALAAGGIGELVARQKDLLQLEFDPPDTALVS
jgi:ribonuclease PH